MTTRILALLAVLALAVAACAADTETAGGPTEGIAVHGDWTIDVYNPDGTLAERHTFENALLPSGAATLALITAGDAAVPDDPGYRAQISFWRIGLGQYDPTSGNLGNSPCDDLIGGGTSSMSRGCVILADVAITGVNQDVVTLSGSVDAATDGFINYVVTGTQRQTTLGSGGGTGSFRYFTGTSYEPEISVVQGQTIQVTVEISFTTG